MANFAWKSFKGIPLVFTLIWIVGFSAALYLMDKSVIAFLGILSSIVLVYYTNTTKSIKMAIGAIVLLLIIPLVAGENRYYMEVASQVGIYVAMALGLNIVVGFAGLLDLGYVAFLLLGRMRTQFSRPRKRMSLLQGICSHSLVSGFGHFS